MTAADSNELLCTTDLMALATGVMTWTCHI